MAGHYRLLHPGEAKGLTVRLNVRRHVQPFRPKNQRSRGLSSSSRVKSATGSLDWLEVHELQEVVAGELPGRQADADIVLFKSNGLAAWDVALGAVALGRVQV